MINTDKDHQLSFRAIIIASFITFTYLISVLILSKGYFTPYSDDSVVGLFGLLTLSIAFLAKTNKLRVLSIILLFACMIGLGMVSGWQLLLSLVLFSIEIGLGYGIIYYIDKVTTRLFVSGISKFSKPIKNKIFRAKAVIYLLKYAKHDSLQLRRIVYSLNLWITGNFSEKHVIERQYFKRIAILYAVIIGMIYLPLVGSYFIQDEWYNFGLFNQFVSNKLGFLSIFKQQFTNPKMYGIHFTPLWNTLFFIEYQLFGLHYVLWIIASLILHFIATLLLVKLALELTKSRLIALLAGLYFALSFAHAEAVYWVNTHIQTQGATICAIVALLLWFKALKKNTASLYLTSLFFIAFGLLLKETAFALFPIMVIMAILYGDKSAIKKSLSYIATGFFVYMPYRIVFAKFLYARDTSNLDVGPLIPPGIFDIGAQSYRLIFYPMKAIVQEFFTSSIITKFAENITGWSYPAYAHDRLERGATFLLFSQSAGSDIVMIYFSFLLFIIILIVALQFHREHRTQLIKALIFAIAVIASSIVPLLFIASWLSKLFVYVTYLDSRHLYFTSIGGGLFFGLFIFGMYLLVRSALRMKFFSKYHIIHTYDQTLTMIISLAIFGMIMIYLVLSAQTTVGQVAAVGRERKAIIQTITSSYPTVSPKTVFLIKSNKPYYGLAEPIVPFQTNFGYTLLHVYNATQHYPLSFFTTGFLLQKGIIGEDYREENGKGFGYFISEKDLVIAMRKFNLDTQSVYAFAYDGVAMQTTDITATMRTKLDLLLTPNPMMINWHDYTNDAMHVHFRFPENYTVVTTNNDDQSILGQVDILNPDKNVVVSITVRKKPDTVGVREFISTIGETQNLPQNLLKDENLSLNQFDVWPSVVYESEARKTYFFNTQLNTELKVLNFFKSADQNAMSNENFLGTLEFLQ